MALDTNAKKMNPASIVWGGGGGVGVDRAFADHVTL